MGDSATLLPNIFVPPAGHEARLAAVERRKIRELPPMSLQPIFPSAARRDGRHQMLTDSRGCIESHPAGSVIRQMRHVGHFLWRRHRWLINQRLIPKPTMVGAYIPNAVQCSEPAREHSRA